MAVVLTALKKVHFDTYIYTFNYEDQKATFLSRDNVSTTLNNFNSDPFILKLMMVRSQGTDCEKTCLNFVSVIFPVL